MTVDLDQDILTGEKPKEAYYKESAQFLNAGEKAAYEGGEGSGGTLAFLTRGISVLLLAAPQPLTDVFAAQVSNNSPLAPWMMHFVHLTVYLSENPQISLRCSGRSGYLKAPIF